MPKRSGLGGLIGPWLIGAAMLGGYTLYWFQAASAVKQQAQAALGDDASVAVGGWPFRLTMTASPVALGQAGGVRVRASQVAASAVPFNPTLWVLEGARDVTLALPGGAPQRLQPDGLEASVRFAPDGLGRLSVTFKGLSADGLVGWQVGPGALHLIGDPAKPGQLALSFDLERLRLANAPDGAGAILGDTIAKVRIAGPVLQGQSLLRSPRAWAGAGGRIEVMDARLEWGPASFSAGKGSLALDSAGLWNGELAGTGALKPNGVDVPGLAAPMSLQITQGQVRLLGFRAITLPGMTP
jgi:hypothetical protein